MASLPSTLKIAERPAFLHSPTDSLISLFHVGSAPQLIAIGFFNGKGNRTPFRLVFSEPVLRPGDGSQSLVMKQNGVNLKCQVGPLAGDVPDVSDTKIKWSKIESEWTGRCDETDLTIALTVTVNSSFSAPAGEVVSGLPYVSLYNPSSGPSCGTGCWRQDVFAARGPQ